jgi:hypothetical protein
VNDKGEGLEVVFWLPFDEASVTPLSLETLNNYLTLYVLSLKDMEFGREKSKEETSPKLGTFRVRPEDVTKEVNRERIDDCSFRVMYLQSFPEKNNGTFGVSDLQFVMYRGGMREGLQPGFVAVRYRKAKTKEAMRGELQLIELIVNQIEEIDQDDSIQKEKKLFAIEGGPETLDKCRKKYILSRK